jgi:hypothetical protein
MGGSCPGNFTCASASACKQSCSNDSDCIVGSRCVSSSCLVQMATGSSCTRDMDCQFHRCVASVCVECRTSADCAGTGPKICSGGKCVDCAANTDCMGTGWGNTCLGSTECECSTTADCMNANAPTCHSFGGSSLCACTAGGNPCIRDQTCMGATCLQRSGAVCVVNADCASGTCLTATGTCQ